MYTYFNFNASNSKNSNINYSRFTKKKKFNKRFAITLHKSSIYRNQIKSSSREFQFVQILLNFPHRYFHKNSV